MIPILNIGTFVTSALSLLVAMKLHNAYEKGPEENLRHFMRAYLLLSLYFALQSLPVFVLSSGFWIQVEYVIASAVVFLTVGVLFLVPLDITGRASWRRPFFLGLGAVTAGSVALQIAFFAPARLQVLGERFVYWTDGSPLWLQNLNGAVIASILLATALLFFRSIPSLEAPWLRVRSLLMGVGFLFFTSAAVFYLVLGPYWFGSANAVLFGMVAVTSSILAILLVLAGILYKRTY